MKNVRLAPAFFSQFFKLINLEINFWMANKILRLEFFFERRGDCHAMQVELLITMTPRLHVRSAPMSPKK